MKAWHLVRAVTTWPLSSQHTARRNALVASTALAQHRLVRTEVDAFLEAAAARHEVRAHRAARSA